MHAICSDTFFPLLQNLKAITPAFWLSLFCNTLTTLLDCCNIICRMISFNCYPKAKIRLQIWHSPGVKSQCNCGLAGEKCKILVFITNYPGKLPFRQVKNFPNSQPDIYVNTITSPQRKTDLRVESLSV